MMVIFIKISFPPVCMVENNCMSYWLNDKTDIRNEMHTIICLALLNDTGQLRVLRLQI